MNTIVILCLNNALPSGLLGIKDLLALSGLQFVQQGSHSTTSESAWAPNVILANQTGSAIVDGHGRAFDVDSDLDAIDQCDAILVPGFIPNAEGCPPSPITDAFTQAWLSARYKQGALVCGSCSGVFALGEAGILNNKRCTTTWWLHDELKQRFPTANAVWASALVNDTSVVTAGGPLSWVDITLHLVEQLAGPETARITADFAVVDTAPKSQALYVPEGYQTSKNTFLANAEYAIRKAHYKPMTAGDLAKVMSVSERTLNRKLKELTGQTPKSFIDGIRIRHACTLLITNKQSVKEIAYSLGYSDDSVFRRLFKREMKITPSSYQQLKKLS